MVPSTGRASERGGGERGEGVKARLMRAGGAAEEGRRGMGDPRTRNVALELNDQSLPLDPIRKTSSCTTHCDTRDVTAGPSLLSRLRVSNA
jgi:hypothetical protein